MAEPRPRGRVWTSGEDNQLRELLDGGKTASEIALRLHRTPQAIYSKMQRLYRKRRSQAAS
jgi:DNA-binding CsgD family transcriptional regulator